MEVRPQFEKFLQAIRLTPNQLDNLKVGHQTLTERLEADKDLSSIVVSTFLQGSYRRSTAVRPKNESRADVDVVVVTTLDEEQYPNPRVAMDLFVPFLDKWYSRKWRPQGRSFGIELSYVELDLVITSAPSKISRILLRGSSVKSLLPVEEMIEDRLEESWGLSERGKSGQWRLEPLRIPDREAQYWDDTHPLEQIRVTWAKNRRTRGTYVNVVKAVKWWRRINPEPKHPKSYPLEHMVWFNCPDRVDSVAEGVTRSFENMVDRYKEDVAAGRVPSLPDHGVPHHDVLARVTARDFAAFYSLVVAAAKDARAALEATTVAESCSKWQRLFGSKFPDPPRRDAESGGGEMGGYTAPVAPSSSTRTDRFA